MKRTREKILISKIIKTQDSESFAELYDNYVEKIYRFVYFKVSNKEETEDLTSEVFLKVWNYLIAQKDREIESFSGLVYRIARNLIIDLYRTRAKTQEQSLENIQLVDERTLTKVENNIEVENILKVLKRLKQDYQEVVLLRYVEDLPLKEIAGIINRSRTNTRVLLHRAMKKLKQLLDSDQ